MRILILGDSLSFPRPQKGQPLPTTWPALLKARNADIDVWLRATPRSCILDVLHEFSFFTDSLVEFDALIVQTGIVDCAPRPYPRWLYKTVELFLGMPALRRFERFAHARLLWLYNRPWVSPRVFAHGIQEIVSASRSRRADIKIVFIPIASPSRTIVRTLPGIDRAAATYNEILEKQATLQDYVYLAPFRGINPAEVTIDDGHHLSVCGHRLIADSIADALSVKIRHGDLAIRP